MPENSAIIIREYDLSQEERYEFALKIKGLVGDKDVKIIVGKDFELAKKIKANGIHFSDFDKVPELFFKKELFPKDFIFSFSAHSIKSLLAMQNKGLTMLFLSPIFPSTSHLGQKSLGVEKIAKIISKNKNLDYIYALGGINDKNIKLVRKAGFKGFGAIDFFNNK